jgi:photosystem II stability/assembly factor-like uncharacterized protein
MPNTRARSRAGDNRRQPQPSFIARNTLALGAGLAAVVVAVIVVVSTRGGGTSGSGVGSASGGETGADFHSLVADPTHSDRLYAGGHTVVSESDDGGKTWSRVSSLDDADAMGWAFASDTVFVSGHPGLNRSTDGGKTFIHSNDGLPGTDLHAFGAGRKVVYANAADAGFIASTDGGRTWELRTQGGAPFFGRLVVDPADDDHIFAADAQRGVAESRDGGRTWALLDSGLASATWLTRSGTDLGMLIASGPAGAARSTDAGKTWTTLTLPSGATLVEADPANPALLYTGIHDGHAVHVRVSRDAGKTWTAP